MNLFLKLSADWNISKNYINTSKNCRWYQKKVKNRMQLNNVRSLHDCVCVMHPTLMFYRLWFISFSSLARNKHRRYCLQPASFLYKKKFVDLHYEHRLKIIMQLDDKLHYFRNLRKISFFDRYLPGVSWRKNYSRKL